MKRAIYWPGKGWVGFVVGFLSPCDSILLVSASIHAYSNEAFTKQSNAFFFHGGSEGLYASKSRDAKPASPDNSSKGKSFIRCGKRYAYAGDTGDDFDEEAISLTSRVTLTGATDHVTMLREGLKEDKRE